MVLRIEFGIFGGKTYSRSQEEHYAVEANEVRCKILGSERKESCGDHLSAGAADTARRADISAGARTPQPHECSFPNEAETKPPSWLLGESGKAVA